MAVIKKELYQLIDALPESEIKTAKRFLEFLVTHDPVVYSLFSAPYDDEPNSEEENRETEKDWAEYLRGNAVTHETAAKEIFGE